MKKLLFSFAFLGLVALPAAFAFAADISTITCPTGQVFDTASNQCIAQQTSTSSIFTPLTNLPGLPTTANSSSLPGFLNSLYKICIGLAATIAILQIMRAGFLFMTNQGSVSSNEQAKNLISQSILGLVLVLSPVIVFGIINPDILKLNLDASSLQSGTSTWFGASTTAAGGNAISSTCAASYVDVRAVTQTTNETAQQACAFYSAGYVPAATSCCSAITTTGVAGIDGGQVCCGSPNTIKFTSPGTTQNQASVNQNATVNQLNLGNVQSTAGSNPQP